MSCNDVEFEMVDGTIIPATINTVHGDALSTLENTVAVGEVAQAVHDGYQEQISDGDYIQPGANPSGWY